MFDSIGMCVGFFNFKRFVHSFKQCEATHLLCVFFAIQIKNTAFWQFCTFEYFSLRLE